MTTQIEGCGNRACAGCAKCNEAGFRRKMAERADELEDLQRRAMDLVAEMEACVRGTPEAASARAYWIPQLRTALGDTDFRTMSPTLADAIQDLRGPVEDL